MFKLKIKPADVLHTKWGNAKIVNTGYYHITSGKEGNNGKLLHRLIFEDFYGPIPKNCHIHHKDGDKTNNSIMNLQILTKKEHKSLHSEGENNPFYNKKLSDKHKAKISESLKGNHHSDEHKRRISQAMKGEKAYQWKDYARVIKGGITKQGKQNYTLRYNGKEIKRSIDKEKLEKMADEINHY